MSTKIKIAKIYANQISTVHSKGELFVIVLTLIVNVFSDDKV